LFLRHEYEHHSSKGRFPPEPDQKNELLLEGCGSDLFCGLPSFPNSVKSVVRPNIIAWIMDEGRKIQEEQELTV
jgi:hypothetical protein